MENVRSIWWFLLVPSLLTWIAFDHIFREQVLEMERMHPRGNFHSEFDASHLLQLSTNRFFPVNDKQRQLREPFQSHSPLNYYQMSPSKFDSNRYMFGKPFKNRRARHQQRGTGGV